VEKYKIQMTVLRKMFCEMVKIVVFHKMETIYLLPRGVVKG
jgi:hypothetical protein